MRQEHKIYMKILLVGGGTGGPVMPLLAVREKILAIRPDAEFVYFGTQSELELRTISPTGMKYYSIPSGKLRRYFDIRNFTGIFKTIYGFFRALYLLRSIRPDRMFSAGSFVSVPVAFAAWLLHIPIIIHQQDVDPGLSNKIVYPLARSVTVSLEKSQRDFYGNSGIIRSRAKPKTVFTGNPVREEILRGSEIKAREIFGLTDKMPTLLVLGGGSGSAALNRSIARALPGLAELFQIIHVTGSGRGAGNAAHPNYHRYDMLSSELPHALKVADIVISRAGFSTISELAACRKISIIVPMPDSHQEDNARYMRVTGSAIVANEEMLAPQLLTATLRKLLFDVPAQDFMKKNIAALMPLDAAEKVAKIILSRD